MTRGRGDRGRFVKKEILSGSEKQVLVDSRKDLEGQLEELKTYGQGTPAAQIDKAAIQKEIRRIDHVIEVRQPPKVSGSGKDVMLKEAKEIREQLQIGMPTREEMRHPARNPGAVRKHMRWDERNKHLIERHRRIQQLVNPDDPQSIETLRKEK